MIPLGHRFRDALDLALEAHAHQVRKGTGVPYVSHLLQVVGIALEHGADEDVAIAAVLHDAVEDTPVTVGELRERFGERVATIVDGCSDAEGPGQKPPWKERKLRYLEHLRHADADASLVSGADKLHNARSILADLRTLGPALWDRFNASRDEILWYYGEIVKALADGPAPRALVEELGLVVEELRGAAF
jgi:(p)ppGpp synthase/HD superfamily hydrolase